MNPRRIAPLVFVSLLSAGAVFAGQQPMAELSAHVVDYVALRDTAGVNTPPVTADPAQLDSTRQLLAGRIREMRTGASRGDIFTPSVAHELTVRIRERLDGATWASVMDDNPGEFPIAVDDEYPEDLPLSTMPATLLAVLPPLPNGIEYRFVGRHLILRDVRANLILDYVPYVLASCDCGDAWTETLRDEDE